MADICRKQKNLFFCYGVSIVCFPTTNVHVVRADIKKKGRTISDPASYVDWFLISFSYHGEQ